MHWRWVARSGADKYASRKDRADHRGILTESSMVRITRGSMRSSPRLSATVQSGASFA